jgi:hypothetical protein
LIPQIINDGLPALRQLGINASDYLDTAVNAVATAGIAISQGVWNLPSAVITATQEALGGDVAGALATLRAAIRGPITTAGTALLAAGTYVLTGVTTRAAAVLAGLDGTLFLNGLESLSEETAVALAKHRGDLSLNGLKAIPEPVARALSSHRGDLSLGGLVDPPSTVVQALAGHTGPVFTPRPVVR